VLSSVPPGIILDEQGRLAPTQASTGLMFRHGQSVADHWREVNAEDGAFCWMAFDPKESVVLLHGSGYGGDSRANAAHVR